MIIENKLYPEITKDVIKEHGLSSDEYDLKF